MKKLGIYVIVLGLLMAGLGIAQSVLASPEANTGITGRLVDGKTAQPWEYGAEVIIIQTTGTNMGLKGSTALAADGTFTIQFDVTDDLNICALYGGCSTGDNFANYQVMINFLCDFEATTTRPDYQNSNDPDCPVNQTLSGSPVPLTGLPNSFEVNVTDTSLAQIRDIGDLDTNRGPTAVSLQTFDAASGNAAVPVIGIGLALALLGTGLVLYRRRQEIGS